MCEKPFTFNILFLLFIFFVQIAPITLTIIYIKHTTWYDVMPFVETTSKTGKAIFGLKTHKGPLLTPIHRPYADKLD